MRAEVAEDFSDTAEHFSASSKTCNDLHRKEVRHSLSASICDPDLQGGGQDSPAHHACPKFLPVLRCVVSIQHSPVPLLSWGKEQLVTAPASGEHAVGRFGVTLSLRGGQGSVLT